MKKTLLSTIIWGLIMLSGYAQNSSDIYNIHFKQNFEDNTVGVYDFNEWVGDWRDVYTPAYNYSNTSDFTNLYIMENSDADQGSKVMRFVFPEGSYSSMPVPGGGRWDSWLDKSYDEIYFSYRIKFKPGFEWVQGGKMPGIKCDDTPGSSYDNIGSNFLMWSLDKTDTYPVIVHYYYYLGQSNYYGNTSFWNFPIESGKWYTVTLRIVMNTITGEIGNKDAIFEGYIDGILASSITGFSLRNSGSVGVNRLGIGSFFGGSDPSFAAKRDEWIDYDDFVAFTYKDNINVTRGNKLSPADRTVISPFEYDSQPNPEPVPVPEPVPEPQPVNNPPAISPAVFQVADTSKTGLVIGTIKATEPDEGQKLSYKILSGNTSGTFALNQSNGRLTLQLPAALKTTDKFALTVEVTDNHTAPKSASAVITVNVNHIKVPQPSPVEPPTDDKIVYIDPTNINDKSKNGTIEHPFSSWNAVTWKPGYEYLQKKGTKSNESKINILAENIVIGAYGEGERPIIASSAKDYAVRVFEKSNVVIKDIHIIANEAISCIYFMGSNSDNNSIENNVLEGAASGVRIIDGKTYTIKYTTIKNTTDGIFSFALTNKIYYNIFRENQTAINISSNLSTADIFNNVFYGNASGVTTTYAELTLYNNIFYLVNAGDLAINHGMDRLVSDNNIFYPERTGFLNINNKQYSSISAVQSALNIDRSSFSQDPGFVDIYNDNFMVSEQSPAIDAGKYVGIPSDSYRQAEPYGKLPDIGLTELAISNTVTSVSDSDQNTLVVYPNPSNGNFNIKFENSQNSNYSIKVIDIAGRTVFQRDQYFSDYISSIDISDLPKGRYHLHLKSNKKNHIEQIVIQ